VVLIAIIKKSSSGKGVLFVDDFGNVFMTSLSFLSRFLDDSNRSPHGVVLLSRLPNALSISRFKQSPVFGVDDNEVVPLVGPDGPVSIDSDAFSSKALRHAAVSKSHMEDYDV